MAEVSGRTIKSAGEGEEGSENSSADGSIYCLPCTQDGTKISAEGFCKNCKEHLCSPCIKYHKKFGITKKHSILDKAQMPSTTYKSEYEMRCTEPCPYHPMEVIKFYCPTHNTVHCGNCVAFDHRGCKFDFIPDIAKDYIESDELRDIRKHDVNEEFTKCEAEIDKCLNEADNVAHSELQNIRLVRDELIDHITEHENELKLKLNQIKESQKRFLNDRMSRVYAKKSEFGSETVNLLNNDDDIVQLFVKGKQSEGLLATCKTALDDIEKGPALDSYTFERNPTINKLIQSTGVLGAIVEKEDTQKTTHAGLKMRKAQTLKYFDIRGKQVKVYEEIKLFRIGFHSTTCLTLLPDERLLITDHENQSLRMLDTKSNKSLSSLALSNKPWGACLVSPKTVVCTMPFQTSKNMQFICIGDTKLSLANSICVAGDCYGVDCYEDTLFVCYGDQKKIEAMSMNGEVIHEVSNKTSERYLFNSLKYIKVHETEHSTSIYAADAGRFTVTQLSLSLEILKTFENPKLKCPFGLEVVDSSQLLVCGKDSNNIVVLNTLTGTMSTILENIGMPSSAYFCQKSNKLYVGFFSYKNNEIYLLTYKIK
ncbi:uncharacterized protein LOC128206737 isoform X2 [Mya arenaria]|nr:uncharacterized protein LOC128206737 isoform X2 [Mya arenaria]XP_052765363.1 uncharacterized protein LOC128206737 isoform X2 [Mya arenaria]XP_052765364.1 uncharacterized protein LOC128206737 isoform X2 [Mya arenaria]